MAVLLRVNAATTAVAHLLTHWNPHRLLSTRSLKQKGCPPWCTYTYIANTPPTSSKQESAHKMVNKLLFETDLKSHHSLRNRREKKKELLCFSRCRSLLESNFSSAKFQEIPKSCFLVSNSSLRGCIFPWFWPSTTVSQDSQIFNERRPQIQAGLDLGRKNIGPPKITSILFPSIKLVNF